MKKALFFVICIFFFFTQSFTQEIDRNSEDITLPDKPNFYDYVRYYKNLFATDNSEGGLKATIQKDALIWDERLHPTGLSFVMANGITDYVKNFNENGNSGCMSGNWESLGPHNKPAGSSNARGMGQIHALTFSPDYVNDNTVYAGSNWGGLWKRVGNNDWEVVGTDTQLAFTSVTDIAIDPNDPDVIYITTGEADRTMGHYAQNPNGTPSEFTPLFTAGVYRTTDGGSTWESINGTNEALLDYFSEGGTIRRILMHPDSSEILYIASSLGIFKTEDATVANPVWTKLSNAPNDFELKGFEFKPGNPQTIYASGTDIYRSTDGGLTWNSMTGTGKGLVLDNLPNGFGVQRINIAVTEADTNRIYAYIVGVDNSSQRWYLYMYNGNLWDELDTRTSGIITPQRTAIIASPSNEDEVYFGTNELWGGRNVTSNIIRQADAYTSNYHVDVHALAFEPGKDTLFCGTDGGVHIKRLANQGTSGFADISNGLAVVTPYAFDDTDGRTDRIMIGNQDTGTNIYENGQWENILGGDGYNGKIDSKTGIAFGGQNSPANAIFSYNFETGTLLPEWLTRLRPTDPAQSWGEVWFKSTFDMVNHPETERMYFTFSELYERLKSAQQTPGDNASTMWKLRSDVGKIEPERWKRQLMTEMDISISNPDYMLLGLSGHVADPPDGYPGRIPFVV